MTACTVIANSSLFSLLIAMTSPARTLHWSRKNTAKAIAFDFSSSPLSVSPVMPSTCNSPSRCTLGQYIMVRTHNADTLPNFCSPRSLFLRSRRIGSAAAPPTTAYFHRFALTFLQNRRTKSIDRFPLFGRVTRTVRSIDWSQPLSASDAISTAINLCQIN